jgi:cobalamin biosynthesis protein CbiG
MFARPAPEAKLRAARSIPNAAAKNAGFRVHPNMQIPEGSLVFKHFEDSADAENSLAVSGVENFSTWRSSDGKVCGHGKIFVEARKTAGTFIAILQPQR